MLLKKHIKVENFSLHPSFNYDCYLFISLEFITIMTYCFSKIQNSFDFLYILNLFWFFVEIFESRLLMYSLNENNVEKPSNFSPYFFIIYPFIWYHVNSISRVYCILFIFFCEIFCPKELEYLIGQETTLSTDHTLKNSKGLLIPTFSLIDFECVLIFYP